MKRRKIRQIGISLVEMMITVAVIGGAAAVGIPALVNAADDIRQSAIANDFLGDLALARANAIVSGKRVVMCKSSDGAACLLTGGWDQGRIVFEDANNNAIRDSQERLIRIGEPLTQGWLATGNQPVSSYISFHQIGRAQMVSGAFQAGTLTLCRASLGPVTAIQIVINGAGRTRAKRAVLANCS
jgi:type IV fimbrial biogenesis protein FimT